MSTNKIVVLLAAYNGEQYLKEQVSSILQQKNSDVSLFISLDLSNDASLSLCDAYSDKYREITLLPYGEKFGGAAKNFYRLLRDADFSDYDYIALSDQDDIWNSDKLSRAVSFLKENDAYSSNVTAFWPDGRECIIEKSQPQVEYDYLFESAGPGCTYVLKKELALDLKNFLIKNKEKVDNIALHDWLIYAFSRSRGYKWFIDDYSSMRYRQHATNQVGANNTFSAAKKRFSMIKSHWYRDESLKIIRLVSMDADPFIKKSILNGVLGRLYLACNSFKVRRRLRDRVALSIACLLGVY